jgi:hypothetical protein
MFFRQALEPHEKLMLAIETIKQEPQDRLIEFRKQTILREVGNSNQLRPEMLREAGYCHAKTFASPRPCPAGSTGRETIFPMISYY